MLIGGRDDIMVRSGVYNGNFSPFFYFLNDFPQAFYFFSFLFFSFWISTPYYFYD